MRQIILYFLLLFTTSFISTNQRDLRKEDTVNNVLQKMYNKLNTFQTLSYDYYRDINYKSEDYKAEYNCKEFLYFQNIDTLLGLNYQLENDQSKQVYNGKENFNLNKVNKSIKINYRPVIKDFTSLSGFQNSILTLKKAIPAIVVDNEIIKSIVDTVIGNKVYHLVTLTLKDKVIGSLGEFEKIILKRNFYYNILIDKTTFLPLQICQTNDAEPKDYVLTVFKNLAYNKPNLPELSWYYSTYLKEFKVIKEKQIETIKENTKAPNFTLKYATNNNKLELSSLKGKVVLLEFWTKNCGYCVAAVPKLNYISNKFKTKNFKVLGINSDDSKINIETFYNRNKPTFATVVGDEKIIDAYGIDGFPTIVIIDKKGIVIYAGDFDLEKVEFLIDRNLK